jgi:DNA topoisomerase-1
MEDLRGFLGLNKYSSNNIRSNYANPISIWSLRGRVLVIAEKPKAAKKIADALSQNHITRRYRNLAYYEIVQGDLVIIVASAAGHLYELNTWEKGYPIFTYEWVPAYIASREKRYVKTYLDLLREVSKNCNYYVNACDYDIEGSVIGFLLIKFHGNEKKALRAKYSSLTPLELREAFTRLLPLDYPMIEAGLCRHELDWIWGINISRALMQAVYTSTKKKIILSAGRVQTPTLKHVHEHEAKRGLFIPVPQYVITASLKKDNVKIQVEYINNPVESQSQAELIKVNVERQKYLVVRNIEFSKSRYQPPPPFNLSDLQEEASRIYGFSPMKTQEIAEQLYLDALISYPRTNSQKLPPRLNYKNILSNLAEIREYRELVHKLINETKGILKPVEGEKEDPAHPAIYPTGVLPEKLTREQAAIYDLIVRRFLAVFAPPASISHVKAEFSTPDHKFAFTATGLSIEYPGWLVYYPFHKPSTREIPRLNRGESFEVLNVSIRETYTKPPPRLRKIDILKWMESVGIGTESTRAIIIEKLFDRGYLKSTKNGVEISDLGVGIVEVIDAFFPDLASVELTRKFEVLMDEIIRGRRKREEVISEAKRVISSLLDKFNRDIGNVGVSLAKKLSLVENYERCSIPSCRSDVYAKGLCRIHYSALEAIDKTYQEWARRKKISLEEYLAKINSMKSTGRYVKEVINYYSRTKQQ